MRVYTVAAHPLGRTAGAGFWRLVGWQIVGSFSGSKFTCFQMFFQHSPRTPKNHLNFAPRSLLSQLGRFRSPTWPTKRTQNPYFFGSKRQLMLQRAKTQNLVRVLGMDHIFGSLGVPPTFQKSIENRSQEASMLSSVLSTCQNRVLNPSRAILRRFFNIK